MNPLRNVVRHARTPRSLPSLLWKNIKSALAARRPEYWSELGRGLAARGRHHEALECYDRALVLKPDVPQLLRRRSDALRNLGRFDEAETSLRRAVRLKPDFATAHFDLGNVLYYGLGRPTEAQACYRTALRLRPDMPRVHARLGMALLKAGQFEEGWKEFERRWRVEDVVPPFCKPLWNGEAIGDRVLLLFTHKDAGFGDTIQFCRYVPQIAAGAPRVVLWVQPSLARLLSRLPGVSEVIALGGEPPSCDLQCAIMRLPWIAGATSASIPATPYLTADPADVALWRKRLAGIGGLRVGLCWAGERRPSAGQLSWDRRRSISLEMLAPLGQIPGVRFISLQKGQPAIEAASVPHGMELHDFTADLHDFSDTAALIENLDLVISVDTAVAHLAGALHKPTWLLNHSWACWRWLLDRDDSPWYPSLRQFRQTTPWDWDSVISRVRDALQGLAAGEHSSLRP
jgi:hypothetical protein